MIQFEIESFNNVPFNEELLTFSQDNSYFDFQEKCNYFEPILNKDKEEYRYFNTTADKSINFKNEYNKHKQLNINSSIKKEIKVKDESLYNLYKFEDIKNNYKDYPILFKKLKINLHIKKAEKKLSKEKLIKGHISQYDNEEINENIFKKSKKGRKCDENKMRKIHNRMSGDNIIKNIKAILLKFLVNFMNKIMGKKETDKNKLYYLNYKYANDLKKSTNLDLFKMSIKDILKKEISPKMKTLNKNFNKILIQRIENQEELVEDFNTTMFILNMKFEEWIQLFVLKKSSNILLNAYVDDNLIKNNLNGIIDLLIEMSDENDEEYFSLFIFYLYNYKRWFFKKRKRNNKKGKIVIFNI